MDVPEVIKKLIEQFDILRNSYITSRETYNETKLRQDYLDHFFIALGWDVYNKQGWSEQAREVSVEQTIKISGTTDFIDYSFKIGRDLIFIAEAKAPKVRIKDNAKAAYQVRRYAWNAKLALCILTNFDEFAIYDCTKKPSASDSAGIARIDYFTFKELPVKWDEIAKTFSKEAVFNGSFETFAKTTKGKKGTATVDEAFLKEIEDWRESLAKNISLRNRDPPLTVDELNFSVQVIIDRIIFLQNCEDRGLERYGTLREILNSDTTYAQLCSLFRKADAKYNSGLFYFEKEFEREEPDTITPSLKIDDKVLKEIIRDLSEGAYEFSVIPPAILGQVYEQFLGKVIRLTDSHQAKVEYKPEVKKAGGVFYTPVYIVEYIVKHTVGELVRDKTPRDVAKLRILDPACGSGSFLIGAYQCLLDWHLEWYIRNLAPLFNQDVAFTDPKVQVLLPEPLPKKKKLLNIAEPPIYRTGYSNGIKFSD
ncbi:MAG: type I restriction endonuclease, partial [Methanoregula sp.]|nr:type I restriction endonuclease [Methanoregula sp.]